MRAMGRTVEDIAALSTPTWRQRFWPSTQSGTARHVKPHVRVGVGQVRWTRLIGLPGPTHEVQTALPIVVEGLRQGWDNNRLARTMAEALRDCLRAAHRDRGPTA